MFAYFSASSYFLNKNKGLYNKIIEILSSSGYDLISNWVDDKTKLNPEQLFEQATDAIKKSDLLVAEITNPSTGVGQQISLALSWKIPVVLLKKSTIRTTSRFTLGMESPLLKKIEYNSVSLKNILKVTLEDVKKNNYIKFNFITTRDINDFLDTKSREKNISKSEFLRKIIEDWRKDNK